MNCQHSPKCPDKGDADATAAAIVIDHCEQGWYRLCNGIVLFEDGGCLADGPTVAAA
ncbi:MAG TPA: DUF5999 family protein [Mycobacteriales bacterium]|nr:DUF5999 family protein [Mycobacteriales bacterium]